MQRPLCGYFLAGVRVAEDRLDGLPRVLGRGVWRLGLPAASVVGDDLAVLLPVRLVGAFLPEEAQTAAGAGLGGRHRCRVGWVGHSQSGRNARRLLLVFSDVSKSI